MSKKDPIKNIRQLLSDSSSFTREEIEDAVDEVLKMKYFVKENREMLIRRIEELYTIRQDEFGTILKEDENNPWLNEKRAEIDFENGFWGRYREYLEIEKNFAPDVINKLDRITDSILDNLFDPTINAAINKKGLVVGQVQSGKTANYTGLICKAADAGFGLIIVLAGIHNNLRSQTQIRIDESFLGFDTQHTRAFDQRGIQIGVGDPYFGPPIVAHSLTSSIEKGDFTQGAANALGLNFNTSEPIVAVIKKNPHVLRRIHQWLSAQATEDSELGRVIRNKSLLLIDDEADNASINISNDPETQSSINGWITRILNLFGKNAYVGYTATPFANIFIPLDDQNLFPRNFIKNIPAPSNYIGPEKVFGFSPLEEDEISNDVLPIVNRINDYQDFVPDRHKKDDQKPSSLPESLKRAIRCFIITCAIRRLRGQTNVHNSMLIHVSRFVLWQDHISELVSNQFLYYRRGIDQNDPTILNEFKKTFEQDENGYRSYVTVSQQILDSKHNNLDSQIQVHQWSEVLQHLNDAASRIEVKSIHGGSGEALDYFGHKNGLSVIAIGGNKLSRGLTLEGLSVSYYLRASRMYDTLMQMGRWFGYRGGYVDLCRLFTSRELNEWFCHITEASEELREEFDYMTDVAGSTPEQYALKVRTHPGVLQISATNKMRSATTVQISWAGRLVESYEFKKDVSVIDNNFRNTQNFIQTLPSNFKSKDNAFVWYDIPAEQVINFFEGMQSVENLKKAEPRKLIQFISVQLKNQELTDWRIALMNKPKAKTSKFIICDKEVEIGQWKRTEDDKNSNEYIYYLRKSHIISPKDEFIDLAENEYQNAFELTKIDRARKGKDGEPAYPNGQIVRNKIRDPKNPLLIIYLLDPDNSLTEYPMEKGINPFVGYAISFPQSKYNAPVSYAVNEELLDRFDIVEEDFEDYGEDED
ncbi:Z1 domain-containing protein [Zobellia galactanivorans]|uniref:Z1 domain-containing protein n=1 Tax=Zobellia galactanivorans (strain DSM 12802 / CCUG 47099 / CIP 106680 / NCIMB 13871 / Dsij) TaxID=63186 RepID=UPI0026E2372B|nr:Z1 domain-containing protein [Zobellia galactanivorans]MDO6809884.1 Z1 domain-containing protein [Zobellia galactanivorans]